MAEKTVGAKKVIAATTHFDRFGKSKLKRQCSLPLTAKNQVNYVVTDLGFFEVKDNKFVLREYFSPYTPEYIIENTDADIVIDDICKLAEIWNYSLFVGSRQACSPQNENQQYQKIPVIIGYLNLPFQINTATN